METSPLLASTPALVALFFKAGIFLYARLSPTHNSQTQIFLLFLFALSIQNIAEIAHFFVLADGIIPEFEVRLYYGASIGALAVFLHLSIALSWEQRWRRAARWIIRSSYFFAVTLLVLVMTGQRVIQGFEPIAYTATRIPGPFYGWFELYVLGICLLAPLFFVYGALYRESPRGRAQNALLLFGILPTIAIVIAIVTLLHFDIKWLNASVILPIGITFFLMVSAYAICHYRIFDIRLFVPWSKVGLKKTAFHNRIRKLISEVAQLSTAEQVIGRLATTLRCPVSLVNTSSLVSSGQQASTMTKISRSCLRNIDKMTVVEEIVAARPDVYEELRSHSIAAVIPFNPASSDTAGWLLLGEPFGKHVYSNKDFSTVEELCAKLSDLFLDKFVALRSMLHAANSEIEGLRIENTSLKSDLRSMQNSKAQVGADTSFVKGNVNGQDLQRVAHASDQVLPPSVTLLGRDKDLVQHLRSRFPDVKNYVGTSSKAFRRSRRPEVLVCRVENEEFDLPSTFTDSRGSTAIVLYGNRARSFANANKERLLGGLVDIVDNNEVAAMLPRRVRGLNYLQKQCYSLLDHENPLIGISPAFSSYIRQLQFVSGFSEPVLVYLHDDIGQFEASVSYLHQQAGGNGQAITAKPEAVTEAASLGSDGPITIGVPYIDPIPEHTKELKKILQLNRSDHIRVIIGWPAERRDSVPAALQSAAKGFTISIPQMGERMADIPLLIHYFVLQFNLQSPVHAWYDQHDLCSEAQLSALTDVAALRTAVNNSLMKSGHDTARRTTADIFSHFNLAAGEQTLDGLVAEFESQIIQQTLQRCSGNKSKAARLLGLRPNTLHYKLERYGLNGNTRKRTSKDRNASQRGGHQPARRTPGPGKKS